DGGWFASQDADSEGEEGKYYVWTPAQLADALDGERGAAFAAAYGVTDAGNFEHGTSQLVDVARAPHARFAAEREALRAVRARRGPQAGRLVDRLDDLRPGARGRAARRRGAGARRRRRRGVRARPHARRARPAAARLRRGPRARARLP